MHSCVLFVNYFVLGIRLRFWPELLILWISCEETFFSNFMFESSLHIFSSFFNRVIHMSVFKFRDDHYKRFSDLFLFSWKCTFKILLGQTARMTDSIGQLHLRITSILFRIKQKPIQEKRTVRCCHYKFTRVRKERLRQNKPSIRCRQPSSMSRGILGNQPSWTDETSFPVKPFWIMSLIKSWTYPSYSVFLSTITCDHSTK